MCDPVTAGPAICLNMIVRNEAHIIQNALDSVASYISSWVIVDTGSTDGTQDLIRNHMAHLGIPGELYRRPWRNHGNNRTEALSRRKVIDNASSTRLWRPRDEQTGLWMH